MMYPGLLLWGKSAMRPFSDAKAVSQELMQRAHEVERAWRTIMKISDRAYARTEARDGPRWESAKRILNAEGIQVPDSGLLDWGGNKPLDVTWWTRNADGDYVQSRGLLKRMVTASGRTASWVVYVDGEERGSYRRIQDAKKAAYTASRL